MPKATPEVIKKAFRRLAHEYHPDKNPDNALAEAHFREIQEAYQVLSNNEKRAAYDHERWLSGRFTKTILAFTPDYLLRETEKLNAHIAEIDVYRMNKQLLHRYLLFLLSDEKLAIINRKADEQFTGQFIPEILKTVKLLPYYFAADVLERLKLISAQTATETNAIRKFGIQLKRHKRGEQLFPWLIVLFTLLLCLAMYWFSKK